MNFRRLKMATKKSWRVDEHEFEYLRQLLESGFPGGSEVSFIAKLEERFAEVFASKYAISFTNGTATLHAALAASGIGPGDEVIVPPLTMSSTSYAVVYTGATLVYADVDPETFVISADSIRARVTERPPGRSFRNLGMNCRRLSTPSARQQRRCRCRRLPGTGRPPGPPPPCCKNFLAKRDSI